MVLPWILSSALAATLEYPWHIPDAVLVRPWCSPRRQIATVAGLHFSTGHSRSHSSNHPRNHLATPQPVRQPTFQPALQPSLQPSLQPAFQPLPKQQAITYTWPRSCKPCVSSTGCAWPWDCLQHVFSQYTRSQRVYDGGTMHFMRLFTALTMYPVHHKAHDTPSDFAACLATAQ